MDIPKNSVDAIGNTGVGLAMVDARRGYRLIAVTTDEQSEEKRAPLRAVAGALRVARRRPDDLVVVILPDSGRNYISKIYRDDWLSESGFG